jgi:Flp pilus assembly protein TadG
MSWLSRLRREQDGQVLLLALGFLFFFGLVIPLMLSYANASVLASQRLREQRNVVYAADGATDAAIQYAKSHPAVGAFGVNPCIAFTTTINNLTATVTCTSVGDPTDFDRTVQFTTSVAGTSGDPSLCPSQFSVGPDVRIVTKVFFHDYSPPLGQVDIQSWTYCR